MSDVTEGQRLLDALDQIVERSAAMTNDYHAASDALSAYLQKLEGDVMEMALCEQEGVILQADRLYIFRVMEGCATCARLHSAGHQQHTALEVDLDELRHVVRGEPAPPPTEAQSFEELVDLFVRRYPELLGEARERLQELFPASTNLDPQHFETVVLPIAGWRVDRPH